MSIIFGNPLRGRIYLSAGTISGAARWWRTQRFGCTGFSWEPPLGGCAHYHRAIDIARGPAGCGDDVLAAAAGTVFYSGTLNDGAQVVCIRHDGGFATGYAHLSSRAVARGTRVARGQRIGACGMSGRATGCHVHFAFKTGFPATAGVNDFWQDSVGHWADPWPHLTQNVTEHPKSDGANIRGSAGSGTRPGALYARTAGGRIIRAADGIDLGSISTWRQYGGTVAGASYSLNGVPGTAWDKMLLGGAYRYMASPLVVRSV